MILKKLDKNSPKSLPLFPFNTRMENADEDKVTIVVTELETKPTFRWMPSIKR